MIGTGVNVMGTWETVYHRGEPGNGACIFLDHVRDFTVERFYGEYCCDGIRPQVRGWTIRRSWLHHIRDDTIENGGCLDPMFAL